MEFKPKKDAFFYYSYLRVVFFSFLLVSFVFLVFLFTPYSFFEAVNMYYLFLGLFVVFLLFSSFSYLFIGTRYAKERYVMKGDKIVGYKGSVFSDTQAELNIKNITNVVMTLPFVENRLYKTGNIRIESAGSDIASVSLLSVEEPEKVYEGIRKMMQKNGFSLEKKKVIQEECPDKTAVVLGLIGGSVIYLFFLYMFFFPLVFSIMAFDFFSSLFFGSLLFLVVLGGFLFLIFSYLDLVNREYLLYDDTISYKEGFLTKNSAFTPIQNLSDSTVEQNIVSKLLGVYDIKISSYGSGTNILFRYMRNGNDFENHLEELISKQKRIKKPDTKKSLKNASDRKKTPSVRKKMPGFSPESYKMDILRTIVGLLVIFPFTLIFFPLLLVWVFYFVAKIILASATLYRLKEDSVEERFDFLRSVHREFTNERITGVVFKENFIDRWFGTLSIVFLSLGNEKNIKFSNVKKTEELCSQVLSRAGVDKGELVSRANLSFSFPSFVRAHLYSSFTVFLLALASVGVSFVYPIFLILPVFLVFSLIVLSFVLKKRYEKAELDFYEGHIYYSIGWLFNKRHYVLYQNIKDVSTVLYPLDSKGSLRINVAGEEVIKTNNGNISKSNGFSVAYLNDIDKMDEYVDSFLGSKKLVTREIFFAKPSLKNYVFFLVVFFPFIVFAPFVAWYVSKISYQIEESRVVQKKGILYRSQKSILFEKLDHINKNQGILNKMFKNGNVVLNTAGSSVPEMVVANLPEYVDFYHEVKKRY